MAHPGGRPTKYRAEYAEQVYKLCLLGATDEQLADFFEVHVDTIHEWAAKRRKFSEARKRGKTQADSRVAESLFHRALGYEHDAVKIVLHEGEFVEHPYRERYPPDTGACAFWLKNRQPELWRDRHQHEHTGAGGGPIETHELSDAELLERAHQQANRLATLAAATNGNGNGRHK